MLFKLCSEEAWMKRFVFIMVSFLFVLSSTFAQTDEGSVTSEALADGTYTILPKIQGWNGARQVNAYLEKITIANGYMALHITGSDRNRFSAKMILQDVDNVSRKYDEIDYYKDSSLIITFKAPDQGRRFKLYDEAVPPNIMNDIIIGEPDNK